MAAENDCDIAKPWHYEHISGSSSQEAFLKYFSSCSGTLYAWLFILELAISQQR
jgi:hypothetical protein